MLNHTLPPLSLICNPPGVSPIISFKKVDADKLRTRDRHSSIAPAGDLSRHLTFMVDCLIQSRQRWVVAQSSKGLGRARKSIIGNLSGGQIKSFRRTPQLAPGVQLVLNDIESLEPSASS
jgi:hypothetical protein